MKTWNTKSLIPSIKLIFLLLCIGILCACQSQKKDNKAHINLKSAAEYNVQLGLGYLREGNVDRAKEKLLIALQQNPNSSSAFGAMAYFWERTRDTKKAEEYYLTAIRLSNNQGDAQNNYGTFLCRIKRYPEAERYLLSAANNTNYIYTAAAYENLGLCQIDAGDLEKARLYLQKALDQDPLRQRALWELSNLEMRLNLFGPAYQHLKLLMQLTTPTKAMLEMAMQLAIKLHDIQGKIQYQQQLQQHLKQK